MLRCYAMRFDPLLLCVASCKLQAAQVAYKNRIQFAKLAPLAGGSIGDWTINVSSTLLLLVGGRRWRRAQLILLLLQQQKSNAPPNCSNELLNFSANTVREAFTISAWIPWNMTASGCLSFEMCLTVLSVRITWKIYSKICGKCVSSLWIS